jgi:hypothetical protein
VHGLKRPIGGADAPLANKGRNSQLSTIMERTKIEMICGSLLRPTLALGLLPVGVWTFSAMAEQEAQAVLCNPSTMSHKVSVAPGQGWPCSNDPLPLPPLAVVAAVSGVVFDAVLDEPRSGPGQNEQAGPALHWRPNDWAKLPRISG